MYKIHKIYRDYKTRFKYFFGCKAKFREKNRTLSFVRDIYQMVDERESTAEQTLDWSGLARPHARLKTSNKSISSHDDNATRRCFYEGRLSVFRIIIEFDGVFSKPKLTFTFAICYRPSLCRLSVVSNVRAPYSGGSNFRQYFYDIRYLGHPLTYTENFTEIVRGEPLRRGS